MSDGLKKLRALLQELFQFDDADLDFGIYRILRLRRTEIERFLSEDLARRVERAFVQHKSVDLAAEQAGLRETIAKLRELRVPEPQIETNDTVIEYRQRIALAVSRDTLQDEVFSRIHDFLSRYYDRGDFLSRRNFRGSTYAVPYAGEEVKLHWANADQYYIKSAARHAHYEFSLAGGLTVRFEVVGGGEERDDAKAAPGLERIYQLDTTPYESRNKKRLTLRFVFRPDPSHDQAWHLAQVVDLLRRDPALLPWGNALLRAPDDGGRSPLERHFERFRRGESFDYFIHKNLDVFLRRELDHYLKTEVMNLDDIESHTAPRVEEYLSKLRVIRSLAGEIITFLAQVEEFQKRLWLKKKFVLQSTWCISMQLVPRELWPEVLANDAQREAWVRLFAIDKIASDLDREGYSVPLTKRFLNQNSTLVLDTTYFPNDFVDRLLGSFDDIEERMLGTLFHAENFQALQLMEERYRGKVKCIYIDPPYNTGNDGFAYKDNYQHSSWLAMMESRLRAATGLLTTTGCIEVSIDDIELHRLCELADWMGLTRVATVIVQSNPRGRMLDRHLAKTHEYLPVFAMNDVADVVLPIPKDDRMLAEYSEQDAGGRFRPIELRIRNSAFNPKNRPGQWFPLFVSPTTGSVALEADTEHTQEVWPKNSDDEGSVWSWTPKKVAAEGHLLYGRRTKNGDWRIFRKDYIPQEGATTKAKSIWAESWLNYENARDELEAMFGEVPFAFAKPVGLSMSAVAIGSGKGDLVLDYHAGSGTTAHGVILQNNVDGAGRRFVLVEIGPHFDTVLLPRVEKLMHSLDWKDGVPVSRKGPIGIVQVLRLESYDDTLDNLVVERPAPLATLFDKEPDFAHDYVLRYMLENETRESPSLLGMSAFDRPFGRRLQVTRSDASIESPVDLVETFHWLLGLTVHTRRVDGAVRVSRGRLPDGAAAVVVWRDAAEVDASTLEQWFEQKLLPTLEGVTIVFVNGDQQIERVRPENATWRLERTERAFLSRMFARPQT